MKKLAILILLGLASMAGAADWPREVQSSLGVITIYQPQLGSYTGNYLKARAAISISEKENSEPVFGAVWLDCRVTTDRPNRMVYLEDVSVRQMRFPNGADQDTARLADALEAEIPHWELAFALDELLGSLETGQKEKENARELDVTPPKIIFRNHPAVLVLIDGEPIITPVEGTSLKRVINTPFFLVQEPTNDLFYLKGGAAWYSAPRITGPWKHIEAPPGTVADLADQMNADEEAAGDAEAPDVTPATGKIPDIVISTEPAELVASDGPMTYSPINGTGLLYVSNTPARMFVEIATQHYYLLASGRWYTAKTLKGPWSYMASNKLPVDFANIPPGSDCDDVLANVSGTLPAKEAILDTQIPQTAEVDRDGTTSDVQYDGDPVFDSIEGTSMEYAVNASTPVIRFGGRFYDCDQGVWFEGPNARGPWRVCINVPDEIYTIPPKYPVYYVRYVRVYSYTPTVVYTGYTSGYTGCYVFNGSVVYGTGYHYRPWYRHQYFPHPWTWGFGIHYDPWGGWSMGRTHGWWRPQGWFAYSKGPVRSGWWGPSGYRPQYRPVAGPVYREGYRPVHHPIKVVAATTHPPAGDGRTIGSTRGGTLYDRWSTGVRRPTVKPVVPPIVASPVRPPREERLPDARKTDERPGRDNTGKVAPPVVKPDERPGRDDSRNVVPPVVKPEERPGRDDTRKVVPPVVKPDDRPARERDVVKEAPPVPRPVPKENNVFADPNGNILRKNQDKWEERTQNNWKPAVVPPANNSVERDNQVRQRATERVTSFQAPPPPPPPPAPRVTLPPPAQRVAPAPAPQPQPAPRPAERQKDKKER